jgi:hypothetical protein
MEFTMAEGAAEANSTITSAGKHGRPCAASTPIARLRDPGAERFRFRARRGGTLRFAPTGEWISAVRDRSSVLHRTTDGRQLWSTAFDRREATHLHHAPRSSPTAPHTSSNLESGATLCVIEHEVHTSTTHPPSVPPESTCSRRIIAGSASRPSTWLRTK